MNLSNLENANRFEMQVKMQYMNQTNFVIMPVYLLIIFHIIQSESAGIGSLVPIYSALNIGTHFQVLDLNGS